jgi:hypothetical protein
VFFALTFVVAGLLYYYFTFETEFVEVNIEYKINVEEQHLLTSESTFNHKIYYETTLDSEIKSFDGYVSLIDGIEGDIERFDDLIEYKKAAMSIGQIRYYNPLYDFKSDYSTRQRKGTIMLSDISFFEDIALKKVVEEETFFGLLIKRVTTTNVDFVVQEHNVHDKLEYIYMPYEQLSDINGNTYQLIETKKIGSKFKLYTDYSKNQYVMHQRYEFVFEIEAEGLTISTVELSESGITQCYNGTGHIDGKKVETLTGVEINGKVTGRFLLSCPIEFDKEDFTRLYVILHTNGFEQSTIMVPYYYKVEESN